MKKLRPVFFAALCLATGSAAQDVKKEFPDAQAVYTSVVKEVEFFSEKGKVTARSKYSEDLQLLSDNAAKMMSRGQVYHSSFSALNSWEAYGLSPEKRKLKIANTKTNSNRDDYIFFDDSKETSFDFPGISNGSTRHIEYVVDHPDAHLMSPFYFDRYFPILNSELRITFPSSLRLRYVYKGTNTDKIQFSESRKRDKVTYTFKAANVPASQNYPDAPSSSWYATHVVFYVESVEENGTVTPFLSTPADLYKYNYEHIRHLNSQRDPHLESITDSLTAGAGSDREKARRIYKWVQGHIKYVAFEDGMEGFIPREAALVCSRRYGDCKDMASILTAMLKRADVPAYFTWIGTRSLNYTYAETPLPLVDNHMICTILLDGEYIFLDGTDDACIFGIPSSHIQGKEAMVAIGENDFKIITVPIPPKETNRYTDSTILEFSENGLKGTLRVSLSGYFASGLRSTLNYRTGKEREDYFNNRFGRGNNKVKFSNWKAESINEHTMVVTADLVLPDYARKINEEWMINMNLFKWYEGEEIDFPKRKVPISFDYLSTSSYTMVLKIPEGFKPSYVPKAKEYKNDVWGFSMRYHADKQTISMTQEFDTNTLLLQPKDFEDWNKVLEQLFPQYKQTVLLSK